MAEILRLKPSDMPPIIKHRTSEVPTMVVRHKPSNSKMRINVRDFDVTKHIKLVDDSAPDEEVPQDEEVPEDTDKDGAEGDEDAKESSPKKRKAK